VRNPSILNFVLPAVALVVVALGFAWAARRSRAVAFAGIWMTLPLLPLLDLRVISQDDFAHDRYLYLPSVGLAIIAALAWKRLPVTGPKLLGQPAARLVPTVALALFLGFGSAYESFYFAENLVFYQYNARRAPANRYAQSDLATILGERGDYGEAIRLHKEVLKNNPTFWYAVYNLGYTYYRLGQLEEAEQYLAAAVKLNPLKPEGHLYLGLAEFKLNRLDEAEASLRRATLLRPQGYGYRFALGMVLKSRGRWRVALDEFRAEQANYPTESAARTQAMETEQRLQEEKHGHIAE
jgi:tetratricopeptide (TPR) repeat protein